MAEFAFSRKTFAYFRGAARQGADRAWFAAHQAEYEAAVAVPFEHLVSVVRERLRGLAPGIDFPARKISKPIKRAAGMGAGSGDGADEAVVRHNATAFFSEPAASMFEQNPGVYLSVGATDEDNVYGVGLYGVTGRQMKLLRPALVGDTVTFERAMGAPAVRARWAGLSGERYKKFPKEYDEGGPGAAYLWHKQFYLGKTFSQAEMMQGDFAETVAEDLAAAMPFLAWLRATVGVYRRFARVAAERTE